MWLVRRMADSGFPKPVKFTDGKFAQRFWKLAAIEQWEAERTGASTHKLIATSG
jgi:predicted DNA-binding transcriptional regulator AlpA